MVFVFAAVIAIAIVVVDTEKVVGPEEVDESVEDVVIAAVAVVRAEQVDE